VSTTFHALSWPRIHRSVPLVVPIPQRRVAARCSAGRYRSNRHVKWGNHHQCFFRLGVHRFAKVGPPSHATTALVLCGNLWHASTNDGLTGPSRALRQSAIVNETTLATVNAAAGTDASVPDIFLWSCLRNCDSSLAFVRLRQEPYRHRLAKPRRAPGAFWPGLYLPVPKDFEPFALKFPV
jgi:hypothetical protein